VAIYQRQDHKHHQQSHHQGDNPKSQFSIHFLFSFVFSLLYHGFSDLSSFFFCTLYFWDYPDRLGGGFVLIFKDSSGDFFFLKDFADPPGVLIKVHHGSIPSLADKHLLGDTVLGLNTNHLGHITAQTGQVIHQFGLGHSHHDGTDGLSEFYSKHIIISILHFGFRSCSSVADFYR
jgi:hypothetical protein